MWGWGKGEGELDSTLAFHQPARKASGNLFRESNVGLSPGQEAPGLLGVVQACPASPRRPKPQFSSTTHLDQKKKKKKNQLNFKGFLSTSVFSVLIKGSPSPGAQLTFPLG